MPIHPTLLLCLLATGALAWVGYLVAPGHGGRP